MIREIARFAAGRIVVATGDITEFEGQAVVNAANRGLLGGGGVDGAIHRAGGPAILDACRRIRERDWPEGLPEGRAVITTGGKLRAKAVIHTVGPVWGGGGSGEAALLASCYSESLGLAGREGLQTIAFPAISTGVFGYPKAAAARLSFESVKDFISANELPREIWLIFYAEEDARIFLEANSNEQRDVAR